MDLDNMKANEARYDPAVQGLHLRCRANGKKSWYLYYRTRTGIARRPKLGPYPQMTHAEARNVAMVLLGKVALGEDPSGMWQAGRRELKISELWEMVWRKHYSELRYQESGWAEEARRLYRRQIEKLLGQYRMSELSSARIRIWHNLMKETPTEANRALAVLTKLYSWAEDHDLRTYGTNPCRAVAPFVSKKRTRYATPEELKLLAQKLMFYRNKKPREVAIIYLLMLTGARPKSIIKAKRSELVGNVLRFEGKTSATTGQQETVVIPDYAMKHIIPLLPKRADGMLFGGASDSVARFWNKIRKEAGCEDLWSRDLRRTFATIGVNEGITLRVIGEVLNHSSTKVTETYARCMTETKEKATNQISDRIAAIIGEE